MPSVQRTGARRITRRVTATVDESRNRLWGAQVTVPDAVASRFMAAGSRRVVCTLNGTLEYQTALMPRGDGSYVLRVNKQTRTRLGLEAGSRVGVELRTDDSQYGLPLPAELEEVLRQDSEARRQFRALTPGRQRTLLHLVAVAKRAETRTVRAVAVARHLKMTRGRINYRHLNEAMRGG